MQDNKESDILPVSPLTNNKKNLKVAICFSGQPRFLAGESYQTIKKQLLDVYSCEVFAHLWLSANKEFCYPYSPHLNCFKEIKMDPNKVKEEFVKLYSPVKVEFDEPREFKEFYTDEERINGYGVKNFPSMFYSVCQSDQLRQVSGKQYDFVVRCRTDTLLYTFPDLTELKNKDCIYVPDNCPNPTVYNDNFSFCSPDIASTAYSLFTYLKNPDYKLLITQPAESIWTYHLKTQKIMIKKLNFNQNIARI